MKKILALLLLIATVAAMFVIPASAFTAKEYTAVYGSPKIDGRLDDIYQQSSPITVDVLYNEKKDGNTTDYAHGLVYCVWDEENLYVYFYVIDSVLSSKALENVWEADSVEVIIELSNDQLGTETRDADAGQFTAGYLETKIAGYGYLYDMYNRKVSFVKRDHSQGYAIEYQIPFPKDDSNYYPMKADTTIGIACAINDDADGKPGREYIVYGNTDQVDCWFRCENYDQLTLIEGNGGTSTKTDDTTAVVADDTTVAVDDTTVVADDTTAAVVDDTTIADVDDTTAENADDTTVKAEDTTKTDDTTVAPAAEKSGCNSVIGMSSGVVLLGLAAIPAMIAGKKKED